MFAAIHARGNLPILLDCARQFSPFIEITSDDTVTFDVRGLGRVYGSLDQVANDINRLVGIPANIAIAANPDAAVYVARGLTGTTVVRPRHEAATLAPLSLHLLGCPHAMGELCALWGIRTFGQFAQLPPLGVVARFGEEGSYWQQLTQGVFRRQLRLINEKVSFACEMELEDAIANLEPLFFLISRFLRELCLELTAHSLATNEVRLRLSLEQTNEHLITIRLPIPMADPKALLKLLQLDLNEHAPMAPITKLQLEMEPVKPRTLQDDLFAPAYPSPEKVELTIARIRHFVGADNIGSPSVVDTHKPDSFVMQPFAPGPQQQIVSGTGTIRLAFRRFRPPQHAEVVAEEKPVHIASSAARGAVETAKGPWFTSGNWWRTDLWDREEWDIGLRNGALFRIFRDLSTEAWFVEGNYD